MKWREALRAMAEDARSRSENSKPAANGPSDPESIGRAAGAAYAYNVIADELAYLGREDDFGCPSREAIARMQRLLERAKKRAEKKRAAATSTNND